MQANYTSRESNFSRIWAIKPLAKRCSRSRTHCTSQVPSHSSMHSTFLSSVLSALALSRLASGVAVNSLSRRATKAVTLDIVNTELAPDGFSRSEFLTSPDNYFDIRLTRIFRSRHC